MSNIAALSSDPKGTRQNPASPVVADAKDSSTGATSDMFMTLLLAQIRNQNPLDPTDPAEFVSQMVQMNQMQTSLNMLAELKSNALHLNELRSLTLGSQIGNTALVKADVAQLDGSVVNGRITLSNAEEQVDLLLTGTDNRETLITLGAKSAGEKAFSFTPADYGLLPGRYALSVLTASKTPVPLELSGVIEAVHLPHAGGESALSLSGIGSFPNSSISSLIKRS